MKSKKDLGLVLTSPRNFLRKRIAKKFDQRFSHVRHIFEVALWKSSEKISCHLNRKRDIGVNPVFRKVLSKQQNLSHAFLLGIF